jgi:hypothetical protein
MSGGNQGWLRSTAARALLFSAFALSLVLGTAFLILASPRGNELGTLTGAAPMSDEEAANQVVESAKQIVESAALRGVSGSYVFMSCTSLHDPPYQAAAYLNFRLPETNSFKRIREVGEALVADGWQKAPAMGEHFGVKLVKNGVTTTFHENPDDPKFASMRIYGECRVTADHRNDNPAFIDITDRLG